MNMRVLVPRALVRDADVQMPTCAQVVGSEQNLTKQHILVNKPYCLNPKPQTLSVKKKPKWQVQKVGVMEPALHFLRNRPNKDFSVGVRLRPPSMIYRYKIYTYIYIYTYTCSCVLYIYTHLTL